MREKGPWSGLWGLACLSSIVFACGSLGGRPGVTPVIDTLQPPVATATPVPSPTVTQTALPALDELPAGGGSIEGLRTELFLGGGGAPESCVVPPSVDLPAIDFDGAFCIWGAPLGQVVHVQLFDPWHRLVAEKDLEIEESFGGMSLLEVPLDDTGLPAGQWRVVATWPAVALEQQFEVRAPEWPRLRVLRGSSLRPLCVDLEPLSIGDKITIFGAGLPAHRSLALGIYRYDADIRWQLVSGRRVSTGADGAFAALVMLEESFAGGRYLAVVFVDPEYQPSIGTDPSGAWSPFEISGD